MTAGISTPNLPASSAPSEVLGHAVIGGLKRTVRVPVGVFANAATAASIVVWATTRAALDGMLSYPAGAGAYVIADPDPAKRGVYIKTGASGAGGWGAKAADLLVGPEGAPAEMQVSGGFLQYRTVGTATWTNLTPLSALKGDKGDQGPAGPAGPAGAQGPQGQMGPAGAKGDQGQQGPAGPAGPAGAQGQAGPTGAQGQQGPVGPAGAKGDKGDPADLGAVNTAISTAVGNEATLRAQGDQANADNITALSDNVLGEIGVVAANLTAASTNLSNAVLDEVTAREAGDAAVTSAFRKADDAQATAANRLGAYRPGETPGAYTRSLAGGASDARPPLTDAPVTTERGPVLRLTKADLIAGRHLVAIEPGRKYDVRAVVQRRAIPDDPAGEAIRLGLACYDQNGQRLTGGAASITVQDVLNLRPTDGRREIGARISTAPGQDVALIVPAGVVFLSPYVQSFGGPQLTDVEVLDLRAADDGIAYSPDLTALTGRVSAQEAIGAGARLDLVEAAVSAPGVMRFRTLADAKATASIPASVARIETGGHTLPGVGSAGYNAATISGPAPGKVRVGGRWFDIERRNLSLEMFGAGAGSATANAEAIKEAAQLTKTVRLGSDLGTVTINGPAPYNSGLPYYAGLTIIDDGSGKGRVEGLYNKHVIPADAPPASATPANDLIAERHFKPVPKGAVLRVGVIGDSLTAYNANLFSRGPVFTTVLDGELREQFGTEQIQLIARGIGGSVMGSYLSDKYPAHRTERPDWWAADVPGKLGVDFVLDANLDVVVMSFGMNDGAQVSITHLLALYDKFTARGIKVVLATCLLPRPYFDKDAQGAAINPERAGSAEQEARLQAQGLFRSVAKVLDVGLIDNGRRFMQAVYGIDVTSSNIPQSQSFASAGNGFAGTRQCWHWKATSRINTNLIPADNTVAVSWKLGAGSDDYFTIARFGAGNAYLMTFVTGHAGDNWSYRINTPLTLTPDATGRINLIVERLGNYVAIYRQGTQAESFGEFLPMIWSGLVAARGGHYVPIVQCNKAGVIETAAFDYGFPTLNKPSISIDDIYWDGRPETIYLGSSPYNHPNARVAEHVYGPVMQSIDFVATDAFLRDGPSTITVQDDGPRRVLIDRKGLSVQDGDLISFGSFRTNGQFYFDRNDPWPRIYKGGGAVTLGVGVASAAAFFNFDPDGSFSAPNGRVKSQGFIGTLWPSSPAGLQTGEAWVDTEAGGVLRVGAAPALGRSFRNRLRNPDFTINQRAVAGTVILAAGQYGHDGFKAGASGCSYTFARANGVITITILSGSLIQVIEGGLYLTEGGTYTLSWLGTAQGRVNGGAYAASPITVTGLVADANATIEWGTGTLALPMFEPGSRRTVFERRDDEERRNRRYFQKVGGSRLYEPFGNGFVLFANTFQLLLEYQPMRTSPSLAFSAPETFQILISGQPSPTALALSEVSPYRAAINLTIPNNTIGMAGLVRANNSLAASIALSAEL